MALLAKQVREVAGRNVEAVGDGVAGDGAVKIFLDIDADPVEEIRPPRPIGSRGDQQLAGARQQRLQQVVVGGRATGILGQHVERRQYVFDDVARSRHDAVLLHIEEIGVFPSLAHQTEAELALAKEQAQHRAVGGPERLVPAVGGDVERLSRQYADLPDPLLPVPDLVEILAAEHQFEAGKVDLIAETGGYPLFTGKPDLVKWNLFAQGSVEQLAEDERHGDPDQERGKRLRRARPPML